MNNTIVMQTQINFVTDAMTNTAMLLGVIQENAVKTANKQVITAYAEVMDYIAYAKEALEIDATFVKRIPEIAVSSQNSSVVKAYAEVLNSDFSPNSVKYFAKIYGETLNWDDEEYNDYGKTLDAIGFLESTHADLCRVCRYMLNWYDRQKCETVAERPWSEHQVSISYMFDCIGWVFSNADLNNALVG